MYTLCTAAALREAFVALDKAGKAPTMAATSSNTSTAAADPSGGDTASTTSSLPYSTAQWRVVTLSEADPSVIVLEEATPYDPLEKNRKALKGDTIKPVSAETAATISFPSLAGRKREEREGGGTEDANAPISSNGVGASSSSSPDDSVVWHYRYRFNKRGRLVLETNGDAEGYFRRHFGGGGGNDDTQRNNGGKKKDVIVIGAGDNHSTPAAAAEGNNNSTATSHAQKGMQREIVVFYKSGPRLVASTTSADDTPSPPPPTPHDVGAVDLNCYHIGYPLDMGDIEDISVCTIKHANGTAAAAAGGGGSISSSPAREVDGRGGPPPITTINCPLHNRIFDVNSGDMIRMDYSNAFADCLLDDGLGGSDDDEDEDDDGDTINRLYKVTAGKWKGGVVQRDACRQRVHTVSIDPTTQRIVVRDSYFGLAASASEAVGDAPAKAKALSSAARHRPVRIGGAYESDKYNVYGDTSIARRK